MAGYCGTETQRRLQARVAESAAWLAETPGACNSGRTLGCDDIDRLGWDTIAEIMSRDGALGFRFVPVERGAELREWMTTRGYRFDFWDPLIGAREQVLAAADPILAEPLPEGLKLGPTPTEPAGAYMSAIQSLMAESGVAPYAGSMLAGIDEPVRMAILLDESDAVAAVAFGHKPHNRTSAFREYAYGGAVAVSPTHRGRGLGRYVNALVAVRILRELGGTHFYEFVGADNPISRRMVEACGLRRSAELTAGMAVASNEKFTR